MVVSLDVPALAMLLDATGPVDIDGELVTSENAVDLLLRDNYLRMGEESEANERRDLQSRIASTIFETVTERDLDIVDLAASLTRAAEGRHLMGWSEDPDVQALWESLGADGALTEDSFLVAAQNATASKRDYYLDPEVDLIPVGEPADGRRRYRATLTLENPVVSPTAPYVDSLNRFVPVGVHRAYVTFTLPGSAERVEIVTGNPNGVGTDGPTVVAAAWLRVPEGETRTTAVEFDLPDDHRARRARPRCPGPAHRLPVRPPRRGAPTPCPAGCPSPGSPRCGPRKPSPWPRRRSSPVWPRSCSSWPGPAGSRAPSPTWPAPAATPAWPPWCSPPPSPPRCSPPSADGDAYTPATSLSSARESSSRWHRSHRSGTASRQATRPKSQRPL